ncbi:MAG: non-heme iron oxygenase ferredoxin subunit [Armatimonadota bacterium]|nr:non-heme iron oxygenase ferredoxin subunit [Armatimonadota bacterium]
MPEFVTVGRVDEIPPGTAVRVQWMGEPVALFNVDGTFYALSDTCSHAEASLSEGFVEGDVVECPLHGARFHVPTGKNLTLPALFPVKRYAVRVCGDAVQVGGEEP